MGNLSLIWFHLCKELLSGMSCKYQLIVLFNSLWNYQQLTILAKNVFTVIKFYIKETAELVTFTEEIFNGKVQKQWGIVAGLQYHTLNLTGWKNSHPNDFWLVGHPPHFFGWKILQKKNRAEKLLATAKQRRGEVMITTV